MLIDLLLHPALRQARKFSATTQLETRQASTHMETTRLEVCPPAIDGGRWSDRLSRWMRGPWGESSDVDARAGLVRLDFLMAIDDLRTLEAGLLRTSIERARTCRDLWHLRSSIFDLVARQFSQYEAQERLDRLNRHFPTRSPRSGLTPLDRLADVDERGR
jgi:hypothetical protein